MHTGDLRALNERIVLRYAVAAKRNKRCFGCCKVKLIFTVTSARIGKVTVDFTLFRGDVQRLKYGI